MSTTIKRFIQILKNGAWTNIDTFTSGGWKLREILDDEELIQNAAPEGKNYNVSVKEVEGKVIFLRKLEKGGSEHSFGIHVAEISGMPKSIVKRANVILKQLEADNASVGSVGKPTTEIAQSREGLQLSFFQLDDPVLCQVRDEILGLDVNNLTPLEALNKLNDIKKIVSGK